MSENKSALSESKKLTVKELREQMRNSKQHTLEDGVYNAYLAEISVKQNVATKYGVTDKVIFTFLFHLGDNKISEICFGYFRSNLRESQIGAIASDFGAVVGLRPEDVTINDINKGLFDVKLQKSDDDNNYVIDSITSFTGDEAIASSLKAKKIASKSLEPYQDGSYTLMKEAEDEEIVPDGTYSAFIENAEYATASNGNIFIRVILRILTQEGERLIKVTLFENQAAFDEFEAIIDKYASYVDKLSDLCFMFHLRSRASAGKVYYDITDLTASIPDEMDDLEGGDFIEV